jgi:integrase
MKTRIKNEESAWIVQIFEEGSVKKKKFESEVEATAWSAKLAREMSIKAGSDFNNLTFGDLLERYAEEVAPNRVPAKHKTILRKVEYFKNKVDPKSGEKNYPITDVLLINLDKSNFIKFRDKRLAEVADGTFLRDWSLFYSAMTIAVGEWGWIHKNCMNGIRRPKEPEHRKRRVSEEEIKILSQKLNYESNASLVNGKQRAAACFLFAMETAMRASEITNLKKSEVFLSEGYIKVTGEELQAMKTLAAIRSIPLTPEAKRLIKQAQDSPSDSEFIFGISYVMLNQYFKEAKRDLNITDLKFHDTRHEGITRLAKIYKVLDLAKIVGHKDIQELLVYYNPTIEELVSRMPTE